MCIRQATNWASRSGFTEIARTSLHLHQYGIIGEIGAGIIGGVGSCWNTPIETIRVYTHRDVSQGIKVKTIPEYWNSIVDEYGYQGLFRGVTPRAMQAIWQTVFLVVVPNLMGL
jgi:Mitochondrial carrier protein